MYIYISFFEVILYSKIKNGGFICKLLEDRWGIFFSLRPDILIFDDVHSSACNIGHFLGKAFSGIFFGFLKCILWKMKLSANLDLIWNVVCFFFLLFSCMMCYLQLHNTRLSSIFMCFSFFFVCGKFGKKIFRSLNSLFKQAIINVCQIYLSSFQENIKIHCFILNVKLKINSLLKICEVNISKTIFKQRPHHVTLEIQVLTWDMNKDVAELNRLIGSQTTIDY
jgi:hypothetical protein